MSDIFDDPLYGDRVTKMGSIGINALEKTLDDCAEKHDLQKSYHPNLGYYHLTSSEESNPYLIIIATKRTDKQDRITVRAETKENADQIAQKVIDKLKFQENYVLSKQIL